MSFDCITYLCCLVLQLLVVSLQLLDLLLQQLDVHIANFQGTRFVRKLIIRAAVVYSQ